MTQTTSVTEQTEAIYSSGEAEREARPTTTRSRESTFRIVRKKIHDFRQLSGAIVNHAKAQLIIVLLIAVNAIMMGIGTFDFVTENSALDAAFETVDNVFLIIFTIELVLQFIYRGLTLFLDGWLVFDLVIIVMSWSFQSLQIIRAFRKFIRHNDPCYLWFCSNPDYQESSGRSDLSPV
jgi:hypothetical protein